MFGVKKIHDTTFVNSEENLGEIFFHDKGDYI